MSTLSGSIRAISPILATLLLIVIVVGASIAAYAWIQSSTQSQLNIAGGFITIENTRFYDVDQINVTIRNIGTSGVTIDAVYINDYPYSVVQQIQTGQSETLTIDYSWEGGAKYKIKIATNTGLYAEGSYSTPGGLGNIINLPYVIDTLETDSIKGKTPIILNVYDDVYAIAYSGDGDIGSLITVKMNS